MACSWLMFVLVVKKKKREREKLTLCKWARVDLCVCVCVCVCVQTHGCFQVSRWMMGLILKGFVRSHKTWELFLCIRYITADRWRTVKKEKKQKRRVLTFGVDCLNNSDTAAHVRSQGKTAEPHWKVEKAATVSCNRIGNIGSRNDSWL